MKRMVRVATALTGVSLIAGCLGGGGSGGDGPVTGTFNGTSNSANFTVGSGGVSLGAPGGAASASVTLLPDDGDEVTRVEISGGGFDLVFDETNGDTFEAIQISGVPGTLIESADGNQLLFALDTDFYEFQTFGVWLDGVEQTSGTVGVGSFGEASPSGATAGIGNATYSGLATGGAVVGGEPRLVASTVTIETDFSTINFATSSTNTFALDALGLQIATPQFDVSGSGTVSGTGFSGTITGGGGFDGLFYGPSAQEAGGTYNVQAGGDSMIGAFGAAR